MQVWDSYKIGMFANVMKYSMFKTFANKYKTNVRRIKDRFFQGGNFTVEYQTKSGNKQAMFCNKGFKRKLDAMSAEVSLLAAVSEIRQVQQLEKPRQTGTV
jgi:spore coat protein CotH